MAMKFYQHLKSPLFAFSLLISNFVYAKLLIISPVYNRPDFIEMQHKTFQKFLKDDYELVLFNDANNADMQRAIETTSERLGIRCINMPQNLHNVDPQCHKASASFRHGEVLQYAFETVGFKHDDLVMLIDSDMFLIHEFSAREFFDGYDLYVVFNKTVLPQLVFFNMPNLPEKEKLNFRAGFRNGGFMDVGHYTIDYTQAHPELRYKISNLLWGLERLNLNERQDLTPQLQARGYTPAEIQLIKDIFKLGRDSRSFFDADISFFENNLILDYKHGSGWTGPKAHIAQQKDALVKNFINNLLAQ